jgi:hypothetical protein
MVTGNIPLAHIRTVKFCVRILLKVYYHLLGMTNDKMVIPHLA